MSKVRRLRKQLSLKTVNGFIKAYPDLTYDGVKIKCLVCDIYLTCWSQTHCKRHVQSANHNNIKTGVAAKYEQFLFDLCTMMIQCNLAFTLLNNDSFISFWNKYASITLPSRTTLRNYLPSVRVHLENKIKAELKNKKLWICVDETTDCKKYSVINVVARKMEPHQPSSSILLASRRVEQCNAETISEVVLTTLEKFELSRDQVLMFVTDGAPTMYAVGRSLKKHCSNSLHITCKIHALQLVAEQIRRCYPEVDTLIASTNAVFLKSPKRIREFRALCPYTPVPSQLILARWGTWLRAGFYYYKYFEKIKNVVLSFDPKQSEAVNTSQEKFQATQIKTELQTIHKNYLGLEEAITKLENSSLSLEEAVQIVKGVHAQLCAVEDTKNESVLMKFECGLGEDSDFDTLIHICEGTSTGALSCFKDYFNYANITSLDVERSFSEYKDIFASRRTRFGEMTVETHLMLKICFDVIAADEADTGN